MNLFLYERKYKEAADFMQRRIQALPANQPADSWLRMFMVRGFLPRVVRPEGRGAATIRARGARDKADS